MSPSPRFVLKAPARTAATIALRENLNVVAAQRVAVLADRLAGIAIVHPPLFDGIAHIVELGPGKEVVWSDATGVVAMVADEIAVRNGAYVKKVRYSTDHRSLAFKKHVPVSIGTARSLPEPASIALFDSGPKGLLARQTTDLRQFSGPSRLVIAPLAKSLGADGGYLAAFQAGDNSVGHFSPHENGPGARRDPQRTPSGRRRGWQRGTRGRVRNRIVKGVGINDAGRNLGPTDAGGNHGVDQ